MSMRAPVDRERIEQFLKRLDAEAHRPGRILLVGGAALVHEGVRGRTLDVDLVIEADDESAILAAIRRLKDDMQVNVKLASPGDFIPLPSGWHDRAVWAGRYGLLDVYYFDFYSLALSKIARASERDIDDVIALVQRGLIDPDRLDAAMHEIAPQLGMGRYFNLDPDQFAANYAAVRRRLASAE